MLNRLLAGIAVAAGIAASVPAAFAADQPRPAAGKWVLHDSSGRAFHGTMHISKNRKFVTSLRLVPTPSGPGECGHTAKITGRFKIRSAPNFVGDRTWYIGKKTKGSATTPYKVTVHTGSKSYRGYIRGGFSNKTHGFGDFGYRKRGNTYDCDGTWKMHKS